MLNFSGNVFFPQISIVDKTSYQPLSSQLVLINYQTNLELIHEYACRVKQITAVVNHKNQMSWLHGFPYENACKKAYINW